MTGLPGYNRERFNRAARDLEAEGHQVLNPADIDLPEGAGWLDYMRQALRLLAEAEAVALLDGWEKSRGAGIEYRLARELAFPVEPVSFWVPTVAKVSTVTVKGEYCAHGHERTPQNTLHVGKSKRRACKTCREMRVTA